MGASTVRSTGVLSWICHAAPLAGVHQPVTGRVVVVVVPGGRVVLLVPVVVVLVGRVVTVVAGVLGGRVDVVVVVVPGAASTVNAVLAPTQPTVALRVRSPGLIEAGTVNDTENVPVAVVRKDPTVRLPSDRLPSRSAR